MARAVPHAPLTVAPVVVASGAAVVESAALAVVAVPLVAVAAVVLVAAAVVAPEVAVVVTFPAGAAVVVALLAAAPMARRKRARTRRDAICFGRSVAMERSLRILAQNGYEMCVIEHHVTSIVPDPAM